MRRHAAPCEGTTVEPNKAENHAKTIRLDERLQQRRADSVAPPPATSQSMLGPGSMLGNYLIVSQIGEGGMGVVYKATDTVLDRTVALKILPPHLLQNADFLHRFRTEAYAQARLHHPNIVTLYSMLEIPAGFVLVMEFVEGRTLHERIRSEGPLAPDQALRIFEQALNGVTYAHHMGIVHRDLKPDNIFITDKNEVKIMDFGVAKILDNKEPTRSRSMVGTLLYISPEQINGRDADVRSDIYTIGISLFETVTGRLPFERRTDYGLMHAHILEEPPRPRQIKRSLPKALEKVILTAIEKEPGKRFQSASEFRDALLRQSQRFGLVLPEADGNITSAQPQQLGERLASRNRVLGGIGFDVFLIAAVAFLALTLGLYPTQQRPQDEVEPVTRLAKKNQATLATPPAHKMPRQDKVPPERDRYDSLRKAWGG
ncbi:MAG: serine/threonine protein kinase [Proteobacteria bacterium]|nr:serine/threonine protein kinase [Pseudomonadota bacterium]